MMQTPEGYAEKMKEAATIIADLIAPSPLTKPITDYADRVKRAREFLKRLNNE